MGKDGLLPAVGCLVLFPLSTFLAAGCLPLDAGTTAVVQSNPFNNAPPAPPPLQANYAPASLEAAARVDTLGRQILAANPQIGLKPMFQTIGAPEPALFHVGTSAVFVTEGLVKRCASDGRLAAVLCHELGRTVAAREALAGPHTRTPERPPPLAVRVGNDNAGSFGPADQVHRAELARYDQERRRALSEVPPPPDPRLLARSYLTKAGYDAAELEAVARLLQAAAANTTFAKQLTGTPPARPWTK
jgi:predicted Zn-dependent protease